jgi:hypothetical protein
MPSSALPSSLNPLEQPPVPPDGLVQLIVFALLNQVRQNPQHAPRTAVESQLRDRQVALAARAGDDASPLVDLPKGSERKSVGHGGGS